MSNPLDLFSDDKSEARGPAEPIGLSSPVQETAKLKEYRLEEEINELLQTRNILKDEVDRLEIQLNTLNSQEEEEDLEEEENKLVFELLLKKSETSRPVQRKDELYTEAGSETADKYDAKPLRDWPSRIEYLKRLYPNLLITDIDSRISLEYNDPQNSEKFQLMKIMNFTLSYPSIIQCHVVLKLVKSEDVYNVRELKIQKISNNRLNTILLQIIRQHEKSRNIHDFLFTVNDLYIILLERQDLFVKLSRKYNSETSNNILTNTFECKKLELVWDIVYDNSKLSSLVGVNSNYNDIFTDLLKQYSVEKAVRVLLENL